MTRPEVGDRLEVFGGYDMEPAWLGDAPLVVGTVVGFRDRAEKAAACVLHLDRPLTAEGLLGGKRERCTGNHLVLSPRYVGQDWDSAERTVHVGLCNGLPRDVSAHEQAWVESHATWRPHVG